VTRPFQIGVVTTGVRLNASCSPFDVIPPALYDGFKKAVMEAAKNWGLTVHFGHDDGSIAEAQQRFAMQQRAHVGISQASND
jgi:hypothetical protein